MWIAVYINGQHLHTYNSSILGVIDYTLFQKYSSLEERYEARKSVIENFMEAVKLQLEKNSITRFQLYLIIKSRKIIDKPAPNPPPCEK